MPIAVGVSKIKSIRATEVARGLADVVLTDTDRRILGAATARDIILCPCQPVVRGYGNAGGAAVDPTRRVRNIDSSIARNLDVTVNSTGALRRVKDRNSGAEGLASVIAARAFRFRNNVL
jgi:hypothetical protein